MDTKKKVVLFIIAVFVFAVIIGSAIDKDLTIKRVNDGSSLLLSNGATVRLIGVSTTDVGENELKSFIGKCIRLTPDRTAGFEPKQMRSGDLVYAYVSCTDKKLCLNSLLLKGGKAGLNEGTYLSDSLKSYREYAKKNIVVPQPSTPDIIDYNGSEGFQLPKYVPNGDRRYQSWCRCSSDIYMLEEACDYTLPYTKMFANQLAAKKEGNFSIEQVCEIFDYCYKKWRYVNDPSGTEYVARASESIAASLTGDCDDFAVLMASCIMSCGGNATIVSGRKSGGGHAWAEVDINSFENNSLSHVEETIRNRFSVNVIKNIHVRNDGNHAWLNLDWQASYPGGPYYTNVNCEYYSCVNGRWSFSTR